MNMLTATHLREVLQYDQTTGVFTWGPYLGWRRPEGKVVGTATKKGYLVIGVDQKQYKASRLAWLYVNGNWPLGVIDHRDTNKKNNAIGNLRDVSVTGNNQNIIRPQRRNKVGFQGVRKKRNQYAAQVFAHSRNIHLGTFPTPEAAHEAYVAAKRQLHPGSTL